MPSQNNLVIKKPLISEKATDLATSGKYVFLVEPTAPRREVKRVLEKIYGVHIEKINVVNNKTKRRKKVIITLKEGEKIDIVPH